MKMISAVSVIFSLRIFAAAMLALYLSYQLDLARPTWAFFTVYVISAPLLGAVRSKGIYRVYGTFAGAVFSVIAVPNLVNAPEVLVLVIALWIAGCLYLSIIDGTPRAYAFMLAGYTVAFVGFPALDAPGTIFDIALSRTEEIGLAIFCVELMSRLPFNQHAGDALLARINKCLMDTRMWAIGVMTSRDDLLAGDRARLMIDAVALDTYRIHAHYDTPRFHDIEGWIIQLQRNIHYFFADLVTFEAQIKALRAHDPESLSRLQPIIDGILAWIKSGETPIPQGLWNMLTSAPNDTSMEGLIKSGAFGTVSDLIVRRGECLALREKIAAGVKADEGDVPVAHHVDHKQAAIYALTVASVLIAMSTFWIQTAWPNGSYACTLAAAMCCVLASLEMPANIVFMFFVMICFGSLLGWIYNFVIFPHIDGFPLLVYTLGLSCVPIGIVMANPAFTNLMIPVVLGINLASVQNRFSGDITIFLNNFVAQTIGVVVAGAALGLIRALSLRGATERLLTENGYALASLARDERGGDKNMIDRMAHRAGLAFSRASGLQEVKELVVKRILLDLQAGRALMQIKALLPNFSPEIQQALAGIRAKTAAHFSGRRGLKEPAPSVCEDIRNLTYKIDHSVSSYDAMRLIGLMKTLSRGLGKEAV